MSAPTSSATIEFPAAKIDEEIRKLLEEEGVRFKSSPGLELDSPSYDLETEINEDGIFYLNNPEARYGEFYDLEELFVQKGSPSTVPALWIGTAPRSFESFARGNRIWITTSPSIRTLTSRWSA